MAQAMKGRAATQISTKRVPGGATLCMTKSSRPKGGVVKLISRASKMMTLNQIRSKPNCWARG